jgi:cell wall-associated NlpC family hydrolase
MMNLSKYIGLPYQDRGRGPAFDCIGFVRHVYREELGIELPDFLRTYSSAENAESVASAINERKSDWVKVDEPKPLDLLLFNILGLPTHVGLYLNDNDFIHCFQNSNSCIERLSAVTWNRRLLGVYRWKG